MEKLICPFGKLLLTSRKNIAKSPQWLLAAKCEVVAANWGKIEKGTMQPGVMLAMRLLHAAGADVGESLLQLAREEGLLALAAKPATQPQEREKTELSLRIAQSRENMVEGCPFGPLFKEVRVFYGVSQKVVAEKANYHLRNMLEVESGRREPGIMTALAMVCATGCDVGAFFSWLHDAHLRP